MRLFLIVIRCYCYDAENAPGLNDGGVYEATHKILLAIAKSRKEAIVKINKMGFLPKDIHGAAFYGSFKEAWSWVVSNKKRRHPFEILVKNLGVVNFPSNNVIVFETDHVQRYLDSELLGSMYIIDEKNYGTYDIPETSEGYDKYLGLKAKFVVTV